MLRNYVMLAFVVVRSWSVVREITGFNRHYNDLRPWPLPAARYHAPEPENRSSANVLFLNRQTGQPRFFGSLTGASTSLGPFNRTEACVVCLTVLGR